MTRAVARYDRFAKTRIKMHHCLYLAPQQWPSCPQGLIADDELSCRTVQDPKLKEGAIQNICRPLHVEPAITVRQLIHRRSLSTSASHVLGFMQDRIVSEPDPVLISGLGDHH